MLQGFRNTLATYREKGVVLKGTWTLTNMTVASSGNGAKLHDCNENDLDQYAVATGVRVTTSGSGKLSEEVDLVKGAGGTWRAQAIFSTPNGQYCGT
jgi:hypothetical protein